MVLMYLKRLGCPAGCNGCVGIGEMAVGWEMGVENGEVGVGSGNVGAVVGEPHPTIDTMIKLAAITRWHKSYR